MKHVNFQKLFVHSCWHFSSINNFKFERKDQFLWCNIMILKEKEKCLFGGEIAFSEDLNRNCGGIRVLLLITHKTNACSQFLERIVYYFLGVGDSRPFAL